MFPLFHQNLTINAETEAYVRKQVSAVLPNGAILPATRSLHVYTIFPLQVDPNSGRYFRPEDDLIGYLLDVGYSAIPLLVTVASRSVAAGVYSVKQEAAASIIYPDSAGRLLIGYTPGTSEQVLRDALKPYIFNVITFTADYIEVEVKPFYEREIAKKIESDLPNIIRFAEASSGFRHVYSPGWFATRCL